MSYTKQVLADIETILDIEFSRLGLIRRHPTQAVISVCTDGIVAGVVTLDLSGMPSSIVTLQIGEDTLEGLTKSDVLPFFQSARQRAGQSMGEYCLRVAQGLRSGNSGSN